MRRLLKRSQVPSQCAATAAKASTAATCGRMAKARARPTANRIQRVRSARPTKPRVAMPIASTVTDSLPMLEGQNQSEGQRKSQAA